MAKCTCYTILGIHNMEAYACKHDNVKKKTRQKAKNERKNYSNTLVLITLNQAS